MTAVMVQDESVSTEGPRAGGPRRRRAFTVAEKIEHLAAYEATCTAGDGGGVLFAAGVLVGPDEFVLFVSTEIIGSPDPVLACACAARYANCASRSSYCLPSRVSHSPASCSRPLPQPSDREVADPEQIRGVIW